MEAVAKLFTKWKCLRRCSRISLLSPWPCLLRLQQVPLSPQLQARDPWKIIPNLFHRSEVEVWSGCTKGLTTPGSRMIKWTPGTRKGLEWWVWNGSTALKWLGLKWSAITTGTRFLIYWPLASRVWNGRHLGFNSKIILQQMGKTKVDPMEPLKLRPHQKTMKT